MANLKKAIQKGVYQGLKALDTLASSGDLYEPGDGSIDPATLKLTAASKRYSGISGQLIQYSHAQIDCDAVMREDRQFIVGTDQLPATATISPRWYWIINGRKWDVIDSVLDPSEATWVFQLR